MYGYVAKPGLAVAEARHLPRRHLRLRQGPAPADRLPRDLDPAAPRRARHPVAIDGEYGPDTAAAVKAFQADARLAEDGEVGSKTWRRTREIAP